MDNNTLQNYPAIEIVGGTIEVTGHLDGRSLIGGLWRTFFTGTLVQDGDYFMERSRVLLQRHLKLMRFQDQNLIRINYDFARDMRDGMEDQSGTSQLRKNLEAREYRRRARKTYKLVQRASARALDDLLRKQLAEAARPPPGDGSGSDPGTGTVASDPFGDAHGISRITDIDVNDAVRVDMSMYQDEATGEEAAIFDVTGRDKSVKHVVAFAGGRTERGDSRPTTSAPAAVGLEHEDDGPTSCFIPASPPNVSELRADEQVETCTLDSYEPIEQETVTSTRKGKRPRTVKRGTVSPIDGDTYTRVFGRLNPLPL